MKRKKKKSSPACSVLGIFLCSGAVINDDGAHSLTPSPLHPDPPICRSNFPALTCPEAPSQSTHPFHFFFLQMLQTSFLNSNPPPLHTLSLFTPGDEAVLEKGENRPWGPDRVESGGMRLGIEGLKKEAAGLQNPGVLRISGIDRENNFLGSSGVKSGTTAFPPPSYCPRLSPLPAAWPPSSTFRSCKRTVGFVLRAKVVISCRRKPDNVRGRR